MKNTAYVDSMRKLNLIKRINEDEKNLFNNLISMSKSKRRVIYKYYSEIISLEEYEKTNEEIEFFREYENLYACLVIKCREKKLSPEESIILEEILANNVINNICYQNEAIVYYLNNYYFTSEKKYTTEELILLMVYLVNFLNSICNTNILLNFVYKSNIYSPASLSLKNGEKILLVTKNLYNELKEYDKLTEITYYGILVQQVYSILHEFCHAFQFDEIFNSNDAKRKEILQKEFTLILSRNLLYLRYHDNFSVEKEANVFSLNHIKAILKNIVPDDKLDFFINDLMNQLKSLYKVNLKQQDFERKLEFEYHGMTDSEKDLSRCLK